MTPPRQAAVVVETANAAVGSSAAPRGLRQAVAAFRHRNFAIFWVGALVSSSGTWMQNVTVPYVIYQETGSASLVGLAGFCQFFPSMVLGPLGGWIADRLPRKSVLLITQSLLGALALALWALYVGQVRHPAVLIAMVLVTGVVNGVNFPSWQAFVIELVPQHAILNAVTLNSAQFNAARALGPALAGVIIARFGASWAFLVNAVSYLAVITALVVVRVTARARPRSEARFWESFRESVSYTRRHQGLAVVICLVGVLSFVGNPLFQLMSVFADEVFDVGAGGYGLLTGALGTGGVVGAVLLGAFGNGHRRGRIVRTSIVGYAAAVVAVGLAPHVLVGVVALVAAGAWLLVLVATLNTSVQVLVPEALRGRVLALYIMTFTGSYPLGSLVQGALADVIGPRATVTGAGVVLAGIALALNLRARMLDSLDEHVHRVVRGSGPSREAAVGRAG